jgi:uncharacterized damage-inducible protein DinB
MSEPPGRRGRAITPHIPRTQEDSMSAAPARQLETAPNPRQQYLDVLEREHATTVKVLRAYPTRELDLKPHAKSKTARQLAWTFVMEQKMTVQVLTTGMDFSARAPEPPPSMDAIIDALESAHREMVETVAKMPDEKTRGTVKFFTAPKTMGDVPVMQFLWMMLFDQIHHRGQFSIYLRLADGKLPSIYGPTADEPWN